jgi:hypothetical protein
LLHCYSDGFTIFDEKFVIYFMVREYQMRCSDDEFRTAWKMIRMADRQASALDSSTNATKRTA